MRKFNLFRLAKLVCFLSLALLVGCKKETSIDDGQLKDDVVIIFENDVHGAIDGYPLFAGYRDAMKGQYKYVVTVSCGDFLSGSSRCNFDSCRSLTRILSSVGYDYNVIGNHEFDNSISLMQNTLQAIGAKTLCCNFADLRTGEQIFDGHDVQQYGNIRVGFVGVTMPQMISLIPLSRVTDESGNIVYDFGSDNIEELIQAEVNATIREGADYVILLSHVGEWLLEGIINSVRGVDAILDAHAHTVQPGAYFTDADGKQVLWTSTGTNFQNVGKLIISADGKISSGLIGRGEISYSSSKVQAEVNKANAEYVDFANEKIGVAEGKFVVWDKNGINLARIQECPLGNFVAEASRAMLGADIGLVNGGGLRAEIEAGDITFNTIFTVLPFLNEMCVVEVTGQSLLDALEMSYRMTPVENGGFLQVAGLKVEIDPTITSTVVLDANGVFQSVAGERRVKSVMVQDNSGNFAPLDPAGRYTIAAAKYVLLEQGDGLVFAGATKVPTQQSYVDVYLVVDYIKNHLHGTIGREHSQTDGRIYFR